MAKNTHQGRPVHEDIRGSEADAPKKGDNAPEFNADQIISQVLDQTGKDANRQAELTMYFFNDPANYGADTLNFWSKLKNSEKTKWENNRLSALCHKFAATMVEYNKAAETRKKKGVTPLQELNAKYAMDEADRKLKAARVMFGRAMTACAGIKSINPINATIRKDGRIQLQDKEGGSEPFTGSKLIEYGTAALWPKDENATPKGGKKAGSAPVQNVVQSTLETARKTVESLTNVTATGGKLDKRIQEEEDALLVALLRARFLRNNKFDPKEVAKWFTAHNKVPASNGVSVPKVSEPKSDVAEEGSKTNQPRTEAGR